MANCFLLVQTERLLEIVSLLTLSYIARVTGNPLGSGSHGVLPTPTNQSPRFETPQSRPQSDWNRLHTAHSTQAPPF
jgi:hypothetical protein